MNSIPHDSPLPNNGPEQHDRASLTLISIGGVPHVQIAFPSPFQPASPIAILSVSEAERFAAKILDLTLSTKPDIDPVAGMVWLRGGAPELAAPIASEEGTSPC